MGGDFMIDFHMHLIYQQEIRGTEEAWEKVRKIFSSEEGYSWSPIPLKAVLNKMDVAGTKIGVILPIDCKRKRGDSILTNEEVKKICSLSSRFIGFASVDPLREDAIDELEKARGYGLCGLKLDPGLQGFLISEIINHGFWNKIEKWNWPVIIHTGYTFSPHISMYSSTVKDIELLAERYPKINFIIAHWGYPWTMEACLVAIKYENVYIDTSALYFDNPQRFTKFIVEHEISPSIIEKSLRNKIIFGSNYPRVNIGKMRKGIEELPLSNKCVSAILHDNAARLLNIELGG
jgi:predicted TIM-barrel fold metal-dependent hydrolase